jgi:DNA-binding CsgD family transcriptional regulator
MPSARSAEPSAERLTLRELRVLLMVSEGASNEEIAARLRLRETTVKYYLGQIFRKLDVSRRTEAVAVAVYMGLIEPCWMMRSDGQGVRSQTAPMAHSLSR